MSLEKFLVDYNELDIYPMHMPGHKRNDDVMEMVNPYLIDVTEAGELDNMHEPTGVLAQSMQKASRVFGSKSSYFLVNGSTCGILAGICAAVKKGGKVMMSRACHKSVYNGIYLRGAEALYLYPPVDKAYGVYGSISPRALKMALRRRDDIDLVVLTSPTYEGVTTDIKEMARICHRYDIPLMVDAAHGAHFGFYPGFPESAIHQGADIVVESIHKTLPALTQTSLLHFNSELIDENKLRQFLTMFQSTSPSYVLMSGIDKCVDYLDSPKAAEDFAKYSAMLKDFSEQMKELKKFRILCKGSDSPENHPLFFGFDPGKIVISTRGTEFTGAELEEILRDRFKIQLEMSFGDYAIAMTGVCDTQEGFDRLAEAMLTLDEECDYSKECGQCGDKTICGDSPYCMVNAHVCTNIRYDQAINKEGFRPPRAPRALCRAADAIDAAGEAVKIDDAVGRISQEYIYAYPPGVPLVVPGEPVSEEVLSFIRQLEGSETEIHSSLKGWAEGNIFVLTEEAAREMAIAPVRHKEEEAEEETGSGRGGLLSGLLHRKNKEDNELELEDILKIGEEAETMDGKPQNPQEIPEEAEETEGIVSETPVEPAETEEIIPEAPEEPAAAEPIQEPEEELPEAVETEVPAKEPEEGPAEAVKPEEEPVEEPVETEPTSEPVKEFTLEEIEADLNVDAPEMPEITEEEPEAAPEETRPEPEEKPKSGFLGGLLRKFTEVEEEPEELTLEDLGEELSGEGRERHEEPDPENESEAETKEPETEPDFDPARARFERLHAGAPLLNEEMPEREPQFGPDFFERIEEEEAKENDTPEPEEERDPRVRFDELHAEKLPEETGQGETELPEMESEMDPPEEKTEEPSEGNTPESSEKRSFWSKLKEFMAIGEDDLEKFDEWPKEEEPITASEEVHQEAFSEYDTGEESEFWDVEELTAEIPDLTEEEPETPEE